MRYIAALLVVLALAPFQARADFTLPVFFAFTTTFFVVGGDEAVNVRDSAVRNIKEFPGRIKEPCYTESTTGSPGYNYVTTSYTPCK